MYPATMKSFATTFQTPSILSPSQIPQVHHCAEFMLSLSRFLCSFSFNISACILKHFFCFVLNVEKWTHSE